MIAQRAAPKACFSIVFLLEAFRGAGNCRSPGGCAEYCTRVRPSGASSLRAEAHEPGFISCTGKVRLSALAALAVRAACRCMVARAARPCRPGEEVRTAHRWHRADPCIHP